MKILNKYLKCLLKNNYLLIILAIFILELFFRIYQINVKTPFGYDQVDNAWAAKDLIVNHKWPLIGMVAKANSGVYIGPAYYYIASLFYWIFNLNIVASQILSIISGVFTFFVIYFVTSKLFSKEVAIIAIFLNTFNIAIIIFDGIQWPVQLLPAISFIIFYLLFKVINGEVKKLIPLAIVMGFAFSLHFTAIFFPIIILLTLPLFPRTKKTLKYILISLPLFIIWLVPNIIYSILNINYNSNAQSYFSTYYHGFHLKRFLQITGDALIQFDPYLVFDKIKPLKIFIIPLFILVYFAKHFKIENKKFIYLLILWFLIPWLLFATYSGEISDYYFIINRFLVLVMLSYLISLIWNIKYKLAKVFVLIFLSLYAIYAINQYLPYKDEGSFYERETKAMQAVEQERRIEFQIGVPESYLYYYYMRQKGMEVY